MFVFVCVWIQRLLCRVTTFISKLKFSVLYFLYFCVFEYITSHLFSKDDSRLLCKENISVGSIIETYCMPVFMCVCEHTYCREPVNT